MRPLVARLGVLALVAAVACQATQAPGPQPSTSAGASSVAASASATPAASPTQSFPAREGTCAMRVSESFTLANDLTCAGDGMVIVSDNITVDLGGHTLTGPGMGPQTWPLPQLDSVGVRVGGHTGVTIRNGKTTAFSTGIYFIDMVSSSIESVTTLRNRFGFYIHASQKITVKDSDVEFNIYGLHLQNSDDCVLVNNLLARQTYNSPGGYGLYLYASSRNRVTDNTIDSNINWGIWFSDAKENVIFHNNVVGNNPPVSDNTEGSNVWYDKQSKEGNWWADYKGKDGDNDSIGDSPYPILGPGGMVDPYPFVAKDGWKTKRRSTIDHYEPAAARPPRGVTVIALAGGSAYTARPGDDRATLRIPDVSQIAMGTDERTLYAASGKTVMAQDIVTGETRDRSSYAVDGIVAANRDGHSVLVVGPQGAEQRDLTTGQSEFFDYHGSAEILAPSYKHNHVFVATPRGIDLLYLNLGGRTPYTIPLDGAPSAMVMAGSGTRIYAAIAGQRIVDVVDTEQYAVVDRIATDVVPTSLAISPREDILYVGSASGVEALTIRDRSLISRAEFLGSVVDLAVSPNGDQLYVALAGLSHAIAVLDAPHLRVGHVIELDNDPSRILVASY
ncbi:MAG TPA: NosD domain-containing protein [Candidatus Udaeobacter sp.]|nr:NosD domain-containing protein [Candidatus Udaeobacter sp.]